MTSTRMILTLVLSLAILSSLSFSLHAARSWSPTKSPVSPSHLRTADPILLQDGQYANGTLGPWEYDFFSIVMPSNPVGGQRELRISMTSFSGDAELFVTTDAVSSSPPSNTSYLWRGYDAGTSSLVINSSDPNYCLGCTYWIAAYGHEYYAIYTLIATVYGSHSYIEAYRNHPINTLTPRGSWQGFYYKPRVFEQDHGIRITTTPSYGAAQVFVTAFVDGKVDYNSSFPTPTSFQWQSAGYFAGSFLHILHTDPQYKRQCNDSAVNPDDLNGCVYLISVYQMFDHSTQYTILITQNSVDQFDPTDRVQAQQIRLVNHVPFIRSLQAGDHEYYITYQLERGSEFYVSLTPLSGLCTLFVSTDPAIDYPNENSTDPRVWNSEREGTYTDSFLVTRTSGTFSAFVYVGVHARFNCTFTITSNVYPPSRVGRFPARLTDGVPQRDTLADWALETPDPTGLLNHWRYYVFYLPEDDGLTVSISKLMNDVEIYISAELWSRRDNYTDFIPPNATNYDAALMDHGLTSFVWNWAPAARYVIGVYAAYRADYVLTVTATYTDQILLDSIPTTGYLRPFFFNQTFVRYTAQFVYVLDNLDPRLPPLALSITQLSGHVDIFVSDTNPSWYINGSDPTTYNWTQSFTRFETILINSTFLRPGPYWIKVVAWESSTFTVTAGYANHVNLQVGLPQNNWMPPNVSHYYTVTVPGTPNAAGPHGHDLIVTLLPLWGRCAMVYNFVDPTKPFVLPDHRNVSTFDVVNRGNFPGLVFHTVQIPNWFCPFKRCRYVIEVYSLSQESRYIIQTFSFNTSDSNNQSAVIQHTVPQLTHIGEGYDRIQQSHYTFHVPLDWSNVTLALTRIGNIFNSDLRMSISRCWYPGRPEHGEWRTDVRRDPIVRINWDDWRFNNTAVSICNRTTPFGQAGVYYLTVFNEGAEADFTLALSIRDVISRYTNDSTVVLVNTLPQVGFAPWPHYEYFRMFQLIPGQQIHIALPDHSLLFHSITEPYPNRTNTLDFKDSRLDNEWVEWPLNATLHYFSLQSGPDVFYITPTIFNGTNDTSVVSWLEWGIMQEGRAYPEQVTHYQWYIGNDPWDLNLTHIEVTMEVVTGNPHLYINWAPFTGPEWSWDTNVTFPSRGNNMWNITDPNFPVLRIPFPQQGRFLLSIVPAAGSNAQAEWRLTIKRPWDFTYLHDGWQRSDWLWHNSSNYHIIHVPAFDPEFPYQELRISLTSWYGDAEIFVTNNPRISILPSYDNFLWRGYDAGTSSLVINSSDPNWRYDADYFIGVYSNEISSYYSIVATVGGNYTSIPLTNHLPISIRTPVNGTQRFSYRPKNYELQHGFRIHLSPAYGAAVFAINVIQIYDYAGLPWPYPDGNLSTNATWYSYGFFEGSAVHVSHLDPGFCRWAGNGGPDERSNCVYLISVFEWTGMVDTSYTLLLQSSLVDPSLLPKEGPMYDPIQEPHNRLLNHVPIQQYAEGSNITYYKALTVNNGSVFYFSLTVLAGWADVYASIDTRYPNSSYSGWNSVQSNTTAFSFIIDNNSSFTEIFFAVEAHVNSSYTIVAGQYSADRLGRFPLRLTNGVPQYDTLASIHPDEPDADNPLHHWRYYVYYLPFADDLLFSINKLVGEVEAFIAFDPLLSANNASYSQYQIPTWRQWDQAMYHHGLDTIAWNARQAGRYVIGVHAGTLADYQISVTAHFTHQVLTKDLPMAGVILPYSAGVNDSRSAARYVVYQVETSPRNLSIIMTTLSGLAHVFVSDTNWLIDPSNSSSYRWSARTHPYQIDIPAADTRQGPYFILVHAFQNTSYTVLATEFYWTGLQLGLPQTVGAQANTSHVYAITVPGGHDAHWLMVNVVPLYGRAWMFASNITAGFSWAIYPDHSNRSSYEWWSAVPYSKPQQLWFEARQCSLRRCSYLIEVNCPYTDCFYTINAYPWSDEHWRPSPTTVLIEQHVPQYGYLDRADEDFDGSPLQHFEFRIPQDNSTAVLALTPQFWFSDSPGTPKAVVAVSRFDFPTSPEPQSAEWIAWGDSPVVVIDWRSPEFNRTRASNRTQAGVYFVTVWNQNQEAGLVFTLSLTIRDDVYADNKGLVLVDTVGQTGVNRPGRFDEWFNFYRLYKHSDTAITHIKLSPDLELYHNNASGQPYPSFFNGAQDQLSSSTTLEWLEWPTTAGAHYFGVLKSDPSPFFLLPYFADGPNATNVRQWLQWGETRLGRLPANHTIYFRVAVNPYWSRNATYIEIRLEPVSGEPMAWINRGDFVYPMPGESDSTTIYPSWLYSRWAINNTDVPFVRISPVELGEYLIAVHAYHSAEASFRITATAHFSGDDQTPTDLRSGVITSNFMQNDTVDWYRISVPDERRLDPSHRIKISLTSWYGEAEFFVARGIRAANASHFDWRSYDAGTSSVIIDDHDGDCNGADPCNYYIAVYANEIAAYYDIVATFGQDSMPWIALRNHLPLNAILGPARFPMGPMMQPDMLLFTFTPKNYQLRHGIRIFTTPAYGQAIFFVNAVTASNATAGWLWPMSHNASWQSDGHLSGSFLDIRPEDPAFCTSTAKNWTGPTGDSDCIYLIAVVSSDFVDSQFTILVSTFTPEEELPRGLLPGSPAFNQYEPHIRLLNNVPIPFYQNNGTWNYFKAFTNQPQTETVITLTTISGWADFYVDDVTAFPNGTAGFNWWNSHDTNHSTVQFIVYQNYSWTELFIGVRAWTNVTYTITLSQFPIWRLGRFPMRLIDGVPQGDTLAEYDMGAARYLSEWRYYVFYQVYPDDSLHVAVSKYMGEVEVYILQQDFNFRRPYNQNFSEYPIPPFVFNHSLTDHGLDYYTLQMAPPGRYVIAVHAGRRADYTITVNRRFTPMILMKDVPTTGSVHPFESFYPDVPPPAPRLNVTFNLYQIYVPTVYERDMVIGVTILSGHCDLYVVSNLEGYPHQYNSTDGVRLQVVVIPNAVVHQARSYFIGVICPNNSTYQILVSDYYYAQLQLGLPTNAWLRAGESHVYGITVPGDMQAHDLLISMVPLMGRALLFGSNVTAGWKYPMWPDNSTIDFMPYNPYDAIDVLYIPNYNCYAWRCTYLVQVYCSTRHGDYCRYGLQAIPWTTQGVSNTTILLQNSVPQVGFSGVDFRQNFSETHYIFHVPSEQSNVSIQLTGLDVSAPYTFDISRFAFPGDNRIGEFHPRPDEPDPAVYFDWTAPQFARSVANNRTQAGVYYMTVFSRRPAAYTVTYNVVDETNRHNNRSAIFLLDAQPQAGFIARDQSRILYSFVSPRVNASRNEVAKSITIDVRGPDFLSTPTIYVTWDGSVPGPSNYVYMHTPMEVDSALVIYPGRAGSCDNNQFDCVYNIAAHKQPMFNGSIPDSRFLITASAGAAFFNIRDGQTINAWAVVGAQNNYTFLLEDNHEDTDNFDLTITVQPLRVFCSAVAFVQHERYPDENSSRTDYVQGVHTVHLRRPRPGLYVIAVYAFSQSDPYCQYTLSLTSGLVMLEDGNPFADYLPGVNVTRNVNESWRWYRFPRQEYFTGQDIIFQVDPLSTDSRLNFYVKYDTPNRDGPWPWVGRWNSTQGNAGVVIVRPTDPHYDPNRGYVIAVECVRDDGHCAYEVTAQAGFSHRVLQDGLQINSPQPLGVGNWSFYRAYAVPDSGWQLGLTITFGRLFGQISAWASFTDRRPGPHTANAYTARMEGVDTAAVIYVPFSDLIGDNAQNRSGYIWIGVRGDGPSQSLYTISSALYATFLQDGEATLGWCSPTRDGLFIFNLDSLHPVVVEAVRVEPAEAPLQLFIFDRNNMTNDRVWSFPRWGANNSAYIAPHEERLQACVQAGCVLFLNVTGCRGLTFFQLVAAVGDRPLLLTDDDYRDVEVVNNTMAYKEKRYFDIGVSAPSRLSVYVEACVGGVHAWMNYPTKPGYPTATDYNLQLPYDDQLLRFDVGTEIIQRDAFYKVTVEVQEAGLNRFRVVSNTIANVTSTPVIASSGSFSAGPADNAALITFNPTVQGNQPLFYSLWYVDNADRNHAALFTICGLQQAGVQHAVTWTQDQVQAMAGGTRSVSYTLPNLSPDRVYRFGLIVHYQNLTNGGWASYSPSSNFQPNGGSSGGGGSNNAAEDAGAVILGVVLPITLILAGIAVYLYIRNRKLKQELSVELPDVSATPSSASARRRAQRGPDVGGDAFSRGGGDMYNSLLGEEESGGDDKRRTGRAARAKSPASNGGAKTAASNGGGDLPEESEVAYRSDVI